MAQLFGHVQELVLIPLHPVSTLAEEVGHNMGPQQPTGRVVWRRKENVTIYSVQVHNHQHNSHTATAAGNTGANVKYFSEAHKQHKKSTVDCSVSPITFVCMAQDTIIILQQYKYQPVHVVDYISSSIGQEDNKTLEVKSYPKTLMLVSNTDTTTSLSRRTSFTVFFTPSSNSSSLFKSCSK